MSLVAKPKPTKQSHAADPDEEEAEDEAGRLGTPPKHVQVRM